ncbi:MAG TPA: choice-of-anchor tandem repeat GloVer-containing protein [Terriglobales bacterium]|nr:choice-of-anchor tandem repeat GloVer-containing protein [Terriglobales bacterium]
MSWAPILTSIIRNASKFSRFKVDATLMLLLLSNCAAGQTLTTLYNFGSVAGDGTNPQTGVVVDGAGNLYGTAALSGNSRGAGSVFQLSPQGGGSFTENLLHLFHGTPDGDTPESRLVLMNGTLFGTTLLGGANNMGTVFATIPPTQPGGPWTTRILYSFGGMSNDGLNPNAGLLPARPGFYGETMNGGAAGRGTVFKLTPPVNPGDPWIETTLYSFKAGGDAAFPSGELAQDASGNLYGTTTLGGSNNFGAVYQLSPPVGGGWWTESVVYSFHGPDGSSPGGKLFVAKDGTLYGTTSGGGAHQAGTVFQLIPPVNPGDPWTENVLYSFTGGFDGGGPSAGAILDAQGRIFGTTSSGGTGTLSGGVIFMLTPAGGGAWNETVLHSFGGNDGFRPLCLLTPNKGKLFGTTSSGGLFGVGTVFQFDMH